MFKKILALTLTILLCLSFVACDVSELLKDPNENADEAQSTNLDGAFNSGINFEPYTIEYKDNGDGTCTVTNIIVKNLSYMFSTSDKEAIENEFVINGSEIESGFIVNGTIISGGSDASTIVGSFDSSDIAVQYSKGIDIVIPEKNPDGLEVVAIDFDGFDHVVPERIGSQWSYKIFAKFKGDEFNKSKFLSYYKDAEEDGIVYSLANDLTDEDIIYMSDFILKELHLDYGNFKSMYQELGMDVPNIAIQVKSITVPSTVKSISDYAFAWCYNLEKCDIPEGVEYNNNIFFGSNLYKE